MPQGDSLIKLTRDMRENILIAFDDLGGVDRLVKWANDPEHPENLGDFYTKILPKVIPKEVRTEHSGKGGGPITFMWENVPMGQIGAPSDSDGELAEREIENAILLGDGE